MARNIEVSCALCGTAGMQLEGAKSAYRCRPCRKIKSKIPKCVDCGKRVRRHGADTSTSPRCINCMVPLSVICGWCGEEFSTTVPSKKFCKRTCKNRACDKLSECLDCGVSTRDSQSTRCARCARLHKRKEMGWTGCTELELYQAPKPKAKQEKVRTFRGAYCSVCGKGYITMANRVTRACSSECTEVHRKIAHYQVRHARRAQKRNTQIEPVNHHKVLDADNWNCYICEVELDDAVQHAPNYPTIDHVIPLARGGTHTYDNLRACCFRCNSLKSDKTLDEFIAHQAKRLLLCA